MNTTVLFVEHLITGLQTLAWLTLLLFCFLGTDFFSINQIKGFESQAMLLAFAVAYPLGILVDNLADYLFYKWSDRIKCEVIEEERIQETPDEINVTKLFANTKDGSLNDYLSYIRMRIRISRSSTLNFLLLTICLIIFTSTKRNSVNPPLSDGRLIMIEFCFGIALTALSLFSWRNINKRYFKKIVRAYKEMHLLSSEKTEAKS